MNATRCEHTLATYLADGCSLVEAFRRTIDAHPAAGMTHVDGDGAETFENYCQLMHRAARVLTGLRKLGAQAGEPVLLQIEKSDEFVAAFWGALLGGLVPVPLSVPSSYRGEDQEYRKFRAVYESLEAPLVLADSHLGHELAEQALGPLPGLRYGHVVELVQNEATQNFHVADQGDLAFLMFSSGSTGLPKGVRLSHGNLLHNIRQIAERSRLTSADVSVNWLPFSHDMGLILFHLCHCLCGISQVKLSNFTFVRRPELYLEKLALHRATLTGSPNFGLDHLIQGPGQALPRELDLSHLRLLYNGAEPINAEICRRFVATFAPAGLAPSVISPGYGIAEACVTATQHPWESDAARALCPSLVLDRERFSREGQVQLAEAGSDRATIEFVNLGQPMPGMAARIVASDGQVLAEDQVGQIQFTGPNLTEGYHRNGLANRALFSGEWLNTGDLGFIHGGDIFITGRAKDIIFVNGQNFYSHDLEQVLVDRGCAELGQVAVVGYQQPESGERIAVFFVTRKRGAAVLEQVAALRAALAGSFRFDADLFVPIRRMPRTTSGKLQRYLLREQLLDGSFAETLAELDQLRADQADVQAPVGALETELHALLAELLGLVPTSFGMTDNLLSLGADSIRIARLVQRINADHGVALALARVYAEPNLAALARLVREARALGRTPTLPPIVASGQPSFRLSHGQEQLFFLYLMDRASGRYNEAHALTLEGDLDFPRFRQAFAQVVACQPAMRTRFVLRGDQTRQEVLERLEPQLELRDLRDLSPEAAELVIDAELSEDAAQPFKLEQAPLFRVRLYRKATFSYVFYLNMHHIITDAWSFGALLDQLQRAYAALGRGEQPPAAPALCYGDWAEWQTRLLEKKQFAAAQSFWANQLAGVETPALPRDFKGRDNETSGASTRFELEADQLDRLQRFARLQGLSLFQLLLGAYYMTLERLTGSTDLCVGTVVSGRDLPGLDELVGCFVNTLPLRFRLDLDETGAAFLDRLREACVASFDHKHYPYPLIKEAAGRNDDCFSAVLVMQNTPLALDGGELRLGQPRHYRNGSKIDLYLTAREVEGVLQLDCEYNDSQFREETIAAWIGLFRQALSQLVANAEQPLRQLDLISAHQRAHWRAYNQTERDYPRALCAHQLFERSAAAAPGAPAVADRQTRLSYGELNARANRIAHSLGEVRGQFVAILLERGVDTVAAILGALKAGAAYLPLDATFPVARIADMLEQTGARVLISQGELSGQLDQLAAVPSLERVVLTQGNWRHPRLTVLDSEHLDEAPPHNPELAVATTDKAYVIFTSGSTGRPKGVVNHHAALANMLHWVVEAFGYRAGEVMCQFAPFSFDVSVAEIFPTLAAGMSLYILGEDERRSPETYLDLLERERVQVATVTPAFFYQVKDWLLEFRRHRLADLRLFIFGGEALRADQVLAFRAAVPHTQLVNVYGPTETTVLSSYHFIDPNRDRERPIVVLGKPIANTRIHLLDAEDRLCPIGAIGEICIGGDGLTLGYLGDPEKTAAAFADSAALGERVYRSGDLARFLADGTLEFVGRKDTQVKLRGYRIELAEIETALKSCPGVAEAVVQVVNRGESAKVLVAWYSLDAVLTEHELLARLRERLPTYMVPALLVPVERFALTANLKIDRKALPAPDFAARASEGQPFAEPVGAREQTVAAIWGRLLGLERVGRFDNFFELGGDSLLVTRLYAALKAECGDGIGLRALLERAVLADQAAYLDEALAQGSSREEIPRLAPAARYPLSQAQQRLVFLQNLHPGSAAYNIPVHLEISGPLDPERLRLALEQVVALHPNLRACIDQDGGAPTLIVADRIAVALPVLDLRQDPQREQRRREAARALLATAIPIDRAPLFRAQVLELAPERFEFSLVVHHLVADGRSLEVVLSQLRQAYTAACEDRPLQLSAPERAYHDFAAWQNTGLQAGSFAADAAFWRDQVTALPVLNLPWDRTNVESREQQGVQEAVVFPPELFSAVNALKSRERLTFFATMLGLFQLFLARRCQQADFCVGISVSGRTRAGFDDVVGLFVNTVPVRIRLEPGASARDHLHATQGRLNHIQDHQDYPLNEIVRVAGLGPEHRRSPLFNVLFNTENIPMRMQMGPLELRMSGINTGTAKFDLVVSYAVVPEGLWFRFEYDSQRFEAATIAHLIEAFRTFLGEVAADPDQPALAAPAAPVDDIMALLDRIEARS